MSIYMIFGQPLLEFEADTLSFITYKSYHWSTLSNEFNDSTIVNIEKRTVEL